MILRSHPSLLIVLASYVVASPLLQQWTLDTPMGKLVRQQSTSNLIALSLPDNSAWMGAMGNTLYHKKLGDIILPGTHDSAAYRLDDIFMPAAELDVNLQKIIQLCKSLHIEGAFDVVRRWALAQSQTVYDQLMGGIRFIDLRAVYDNSTGVWRTDHTLMGDDIATIVKDIQKFVEQRSSEIVVVQVSHFAGADCDARLDQLALIIEQSLGQYLYPPSQRQKLNVSQIMVGDMVSQRKNVIVTVSNEQMYSKYKHFWLENDVFEGQYANSNILNSMEDHNVQQMKMYGGNGRLFQMFFTLTMQGADDVEKGLLDPIQFPNSLLQLANIANHDLDEWINVQKKKFFIANIILVDFYQDTNIVELVKELNQRLDVCNDSSVDRDARRCRSWAGNCTDKSVQQACQLSCGKCPDLKGIAGTVCIEDSDCMSNKCVPETRGFYSYCLPTDPLPNGYPCGANSQCWSGHCGLSNNICAGRPIDAFCASSAQCGSKLCIAGRCAGNVSIEVVGSGWSCPKYGWESMCDDDVSGKVYLTSTQCLGSTPCLSGHNVVCSNALHNYRSFYWSGSAPFCKADCGKDSLLFETSCGNGSMCVTGQKGLCGVY